MWAGWLLTEVSYACTRWTISRMELADNLAREETSESRPGTNTSVSDDNSWPRVRDGTPGKNTKFPSRAEFQRKKLARIECDIAGAVRHRAAGTIVRPARASRVAREVHAIVYAGCVCDVDTKLECIDACLLLRTLLDFSRNHERKGCSGKKQRRECHGEDDICHFGHHPEDVSWFGGWKSKLLLEREEVVLDGRLQDGTWMGS
eukprot:2586400-Rhodomonas_salina.3